jgi:hypothetical protein
LLPFLSARDDNWMFPFKIVKKMLVSAMFPFYFRESLAKCEKGLETPDHESRFSAAKYFPYL